MLESIEILEKAKQSKLNNENFKKEEKDENIWKKIGNFFTNPFKCGNNTN